MRAPEPATTQADSRLPSLRLALLHRKWRGRGPASQRHLMCGPRLRKLGAWRRTQLACLLATAAFLPSASLAKLDVVATLPDFGAVAKVIGGDHVEVQSLAHGSEDPHFVDPRPSFIRVLNRADVLIEGGCELEAGWLPPLVQTARNRKILTEPGHVNASKGVTLIDVPRGPVDRSQGDVHLSGNPHYLLDPANAKAVAATIAGAFAQLDPSHAGVFRANLKAFQDQLDAKLGLWTELLAPFRGTKVITYHKTFDYLLHRFGFSLLDTIEPKPGIEPTPGHIEALIGRAKQQGVKLILIESHRPRKVPQLVADQIGARLLVLPGMVGAHPEARDLVEWLDYNVTQIRQALGHD